MKVGWKVRSGTSERECYKNDCENGLPRLRETEM